MSHLNDDHSQSSMKKKSAGKLPEDSSRNSFSKSDARYWYAEGRLFKDHGVADYSFRVSHKGRRGQFCLNTGNMKSAAKRAAEIYDLIAREGWVVADERHRPQNINTKVEVITVGDYIKAACSLSSARRHTLEAYAKALRKIVSDIKNINPKNKHHSYDGGSAEWRKEIDSVDLSSIASSDILAWKNGRLRAAENDPLKKRNAIITVNSLIRNAKSLFGKKILPFIASSFNVPIPLPFEGVGMEKAPSMRYVSKIDPYALLATAKEQLMKSDPEVFKVLVLALICGLRRSEIDNLLWRAFDFPSSSLRIETTEYHQLKSEDSAGLIDLDADMLALFRTFRAKHPKSLFVIESPKKPSKQLKARGYRCDPVFERSLTWLRGQGVDSNKPLHTLRKEIGSIIASEHGIFAASRYLRHSDIRITSAIYADKKHTVVPKAFAGLLSNTKPEP